LGYETQFVVSSNKIITVDKKIKGRGGERERERERERESTNRVDAGGGVVVYPQQERTKASAVGDNRKELSLCLKVKP
jgi:hypothetical protein